MISTRRNTAVDHCSCQEIDHLVLPSTRLAESPTGPMTTFHPRGTTTSINSQKYLPFPLLLLQLHRSPITVASGRTTYVQSNTDHIYTSAIATSFLPRITVPLQLVTLRNLVIPDTLTQSASMLWCNHNTAGMSVNTCRCSK